MKGYRADKPGGPESLQLLDLEMPRPGPREVLLRVTAIGVNRLDAMQRAGNYPLAPGVTPVLGVECAGEVVEVGQDVADIAAGARVFALVPGGAYAEYVCVHHEHVVPTPAHWSDALAAAVIETFCTANETLFTVGRLKAGDRALIHAAGSAVGSTAVQMALLRGAEVIATAGTPGKIEGVRALGAHHVIDYKSCDFAEAVLGIHPDGIDFIEDFVGPAYLARHLRILRWLGRITMVGLLSSGSAETETAPILLKQLSINGFTLRPQGIAEKTAIIARFRRDWMPQLVSGAIRPVMHAELKFPEAVRAHRMLDANENFGKIVMTF